jgi:hypothetical protein
MTRKDIEEAGTVGLEWSFDRPAGGPVLITTDNAMRIYAVWESEYPDEGSTLIEAFSESGARRKWRLATRTNGPVSEQPDLTVTEITPEKARKLGCA